MRKFRGSELQEHANCPRKYFYKYVQQLRSKRFHGVARPVGSAVHEGLRALYDGCTPAEALVKARALYEKEVGPALLSEEDAEKVDEGRKQATVCLTKYPWGPDNFDEILELEREFEIEVRGYKFIGRIDRLVRTNGQLWVHDIKTTGLEIRQMLKVQKIRHQYSGYVKAAEELIGEKVVGVLIELIKKPRVYHRKDGTWTVSDPGYLREPHPRTALTEEEFEIFVDRNAGLISEHGLDEVESEFPMNTDHCLAFNRLCEYHELCAFPEWREKTKAQFFQVTEKNE